MLVPLGLSFLAALSLVNAHTHDELSEQYTYNLQLDNEGRYTMLYSYDTELTIYSLNFLLKSVFMFRCTSNETFQISTHK